MTHLTLAFLLLTPAVWFIPVAIYSPNESSFKEDLPRIIVFFVLFVLPLWAVYLLLK